MILHLPTVTSDDLAEARAMVRDPKASAADVANACFVLAQSKDPDDQMIARNLRNAAWATKGSEILPVDRIARPVEFSAMTGSAGYMAQPGVDWTRAHVRPVAPKTSTLRGWLEVAAWVILIAALVYIAAQLPQALSDAMIVGDAAPMGAW